MSQWDAARAASKKKILLFATLHGDMQPTLVSYAQPSLGPHCKAPIKSRDSQYGYKKNHFQVQGKNSSLISFKY